MEKIKLLDCTLRDGGYINNWNFGRRTIRNILSRLVDAGTDYIEVGFLRNCTYDEDKTVFNNIEEMKKVLPENRKNSKFVAMALHNQYDISRLEYNDGTIDAIRVTFHDFDIEEGLTFCREVKEKGYNLFINPINIMGYSDPELLKLLQKINELKPYGFSIVDTFGSMTKAELVRIYSLCENNLDKDIVLGLHLHENLAMSFSLAQSFLEIRLHQRCCILDASLNGMGRVPGNLCMELIMDFLNKNYGTHYDIDYILDAIEEHIMPVKKTESWGYATEYFLSAKYNLHRNYAEFLQEKGSLTTKDMNYILRALPKEKKTVYDQAYIESLYEKYVNHMVMDENSIEALKTIFGGKKVLVLAPGSSLSKRWEDVKQYLENREVLVVSANFYFDEIESGYAFFSNSKRFEEYRSSRKESSRVILTSNITKGSEDRDYIISYYRLAAGKNGISDNCGVMLLRLLGLLGVSEAALAGFDGFEENKENYMKGYFGEFYHARMGDNEKIARELKEIKKKLYIRFLTPSRYEEDL